MYCLNNVIISIVVVCDDSAGVGDRRKVADIDVVTVHSGECVVSSWVIFCCNGYFLFVWFHGIGVPVTLHLV